ncbi:serine/threonine-protein kinase [Streptomyces sp. NPDC048604]|uniref:serine/threonine-protein kinase n=1 Tax=Streptomyces sp. NPDC048604 TaxID=3365578 RepID=UPI003724842F
MDPLHPEDPVAIGPFRLLGRLGVGGMGRVFLARSEGGRTVAVKVVHAELAEQDEFRRRFAREVAALERVGGTGTTPVLASDTSAHAPWVAIGYVPGPSLRTVVADEHGPLPPASVRALGAGLARALGHVHAAGLVHRDLKPSNVLLTVDGPQIIDFGIARAVDTITDGGLTSTGAVVGSPGFMSPEQVRGEKLTPASDVFCLGSVLVYAATGRAPFGTVDSGVHATMFRIAHDEPDLAGLPAELAGLARACLAKEPADRPTAVELAEALPVAEPWLPAEVLAGLGRHAARVLEAEAAAAASPVPTTGRGAAPVDPTAPAAPAPRRRRRGPVALLAALAVAAAATVTYVYWPDPSKGADAQKDLPAGTTDGVAARPAGIVPAALVGAWEGVLRGTADAPYETARVEITQGAAGSKTAVYVQVSGDRLCMGRSVLVSADQDKVVLGDSDVTTSVPAGRCTAVAQQTLTLRGSNVAEWTSGAVRATFRKAKTGQDVVPAALVGRWKELPYPNLPEGEKAPDSGGYIRRLTVTQGPVGASLVRYEYTGPRTDDQGNPTGETYSCTATAVLGGTAPYLVLGPEVRDPEVWDTKDCAENGSANLRIQRRDGKEQLLVYGMEADGEPGVYVRP